ncbi:hypothetical protein ACTJJ7_15820 [Phyllobacterium sp. 22229]|uniref:hypothetical protein n=1 Tax=Phyllobacterium sp. 22229 TaxID=3453895 RepID=UPI003F87DC9B
MDDLEGAHMTLLAIWHRKDQGLIFAAADSRLTNSDGSILTNHAPKFTSCRVSCFAIGAKKHTRVFDTNIAIGYAGSSSVAFATIATLQAYTSVLALKEHGQIPRIADIGELARRILESNFKDFGAIWDIKSVCDMVVLGKMPHDRNVQVAHLQCTVKDGVAAVKLNMLSIIDQDICAAFGSGSSYFFEQLEIDKVGGGRFEPINLINRIIRNDERKDIGGDLQLVTAGKNGVEFPFIVKDRAKFGKNAMDVSFLGRRSDVLGLVGDCTIGLVARR